MLSFDAYQSPEPRTAVSRRTFLSASPPCRRGRRSKDERGGLNEKLLRFAHSGNDPNNASSSDCDHVGLTTDYCQREDIDIDLDLATNLAAEFVSKFQDIASQLCSINDHSEKRAEICCVNLCQLNNIIYDKYFQFSYGGKELFRKIIMAGGTDLLIEISKRIDLTKESLVGSMDHYVALIKTIEIRDRLDGALNASTIGDINVE